MTSHEEQLRQAVELADQAGAVVAGLKTGSFDSAQTLALISIAKSLTVLADQQSQR